MLVDHSFADQVFFCNSGAEANEAAIKLARRYSHDKYGPGRFEIITMKNSFHGRTFATIDGHRSGKGAERLRAADPGFRYVPSIIFRRLQAGDPQDRGDHARADSG